MKLPADVFLHRVLQISPVFRREMSWFTSQRRPLKDSGSVLSPGRLSDSSPRGKKVSHNLLPLVAPFHFLSVPRRSLPFLKPPFATQSLFAVDIV